MHPKNDRALTRFLWLGFLLSCTACGGCLTDTDLNGQLVGKCIGDSNSWPGWPDPSVQRWCQFLPTTAYEPHQNTDLPVVIWSSAEFSDYTFSACPSGTGFTSGVPQLQAALAAHPDLDFVMVALGTNDLGSGIQPAAIVQCLQDMKAITLAAGLRWFVATVPPRQEVTEAAALVEPLNDLIRANFPAGEIMDFSTGFTPDLYSDYLHLNQDGQHLRAQRAAAQW